MLDWLEFHNNWFWLNWNKIIEIKEYNFCCHCGNPSLRQFLLPRHNRQFHLPWHNHGITRRTCTVRHLLKCDKTKSLSWVYQHWRGIGSYFFSCIDVLMATCLHTSLTKVHKDPLEIALKAMQHPWGVSIHFLIFSSCSSKRMVHGLPARSFIWRTWKII